MRDKVVYKELSYQIVGILFDVYNTLGAGHLEKVYQNAIVEALKNRKIPFKQQVYCQLDFEGNRVGHYYLDFLIDDKIILEIKAKEHFSRQDFKQVKNYLNVNSLKLGILAGFANNSVKFARIFKEI